MSSMFRPNLAEVRERNRGRRNEHNNHVNNNDRTHNRTNNRTNNRINSYINNSDNNGHNRKSNDQTDGDIPVLTLKNSLSQISFCDRECYNINSDRTKETIIKYVQNKHKIRIIDRQYVTLDNNKMRNISHNEHIVSTYSNGNPYLLLLTKIDETPCCIFIDRKCKEGYNYPKMHAVQYKFARQLFDTDTLFTGELIRDINREWQFLIADLLVYEGESTRNKNILTRFEIINNILDNHYLRDPTQEICPIYCKRLFQYCDLDNIFNNFMPDLSYVCKGLVFYTLNNKFSNYCWIMPRDHQISVRHKHEYQVPNVNNGQYDMSTNITDINTSVMPAPITPHTYQEATHCAQVNQISANDTELDSLELPRFNIIKTGTPDIYHLFSADNQVDRICVAFIPDLATSQWLYKHFIDNPANTLNTVVECKYHTEFDKWVPVSICNDSVKSHSLADLDADLAAVAISGNSSSEAIEKIKSVAMATVSDADSNIKNIKNIKHAIYA